MNCTLISGRIGRDATFRTFGVDSVINFSIAVSKKYKDENGNKAERTTWFDCSYWNAPEKLLPFLLKGTLVNLRGEVDSRIYQDINKNYKSALTLKVEFLELMSSSNDNKKETEPATAANANTNTDTDTDAIAVDVTCDGDDLPF